MGCTLEIIWGLEQMLIFLFHVNQNGAMSGYHDFRMSANSNRFDSTHNRVYMYVFNFKVFWLGLAMSINYVSRKKSMAKIFVNA